MSESERFWDQVDYSIALQRAIEYHCRGSQVPPNIAERCPHHARMLNKARAEDITELDHRVEKPEEGVSLLETIMELHSQRLPDLSFLIARHNRIAEPAAQERNELTSWLVALQERISKLERLPEKEE